MKTIPIHPITDWMTTFLLKVLSQTISQKRVLRFLQIVRTEKHDRTLWKLAVLEHCLSIYQACDNKHVWAQRVAAFRMFCRSKCLDTVRSRWQNLQKIWIGTLFCCTASCVQALNRLWIRTILSCFRFPPLQSILWLVSSVHWNMIGTTNKNVSYLRDVFFILSYKRFITAWTLGEQIKLGETNQQKLS